jgi:hypothetical protein
MTKTIDMRKTTDLMAHRQESFMGDDHYRQGPVPSKTIGDAEWAHGAEQWAARAAATYLTQGQLAALTHRLIDHAWPLELITGAVHALQDLHRHTVWCSTLASKLSGGVPIALPTPLARAELRARQDLDPGALDIALEFLDLYGFNFTFSLPILDACAAITSDAMISEICETIGDDLSGHIEFGWNALAWLVRHGDGVSPAALEEAVVTLMSTYERLCYAGAEVLDDLAGQEIIVEGQQANLATLSSTQYAAIFYHTVTEQLIPRLSTLGIDGEQAWHRHYRPKAPTHPRQSCLMALRCA